MSWTRAWQPDGQPPSLPMSPTRSRRGHPDSLLTRLAADTSGSEQPQLPASSRVRSGADMALGPQRRRGVNARNAVTGCPACPAPRAAAKSGDELLSCELGAGTGRVVI